MTIDLDAYFARIGYDGPREANLATLKAIHALHPAAIPFENLDPLLARPVRLDLPSLEAKLVRERRGGYCFEQNALFRAVLEALGFAVTPLIARVVWMAPPDRPMGPRNHMLLKVDLAEGPFIADVGFGGQLISAPLRLVVDQTQVTAEARWRLVADGEALLIQTELPFGWTSAYRFTLEPAELADYEMSSWYTSAHPTSLFISNLLVERLTPQARLTLFNARLTRRHTDGRVEEAVLAGPEELARVLEHDFGLTPPADAAAVFARLPPD
jgi:N-hydroxyarylamine O-acetyltransferase